MCPSTRTFLLYIFFVFSTPKTAKPNTFENATITCVLYTETTANRSITTKELTANLKTACVEEATEEEAHVIVEGWVPKLRKDSVSDMHNLLELKISGIGVREIEPGAFRNVPQLHTLHLDHNELEAIRSGTFANLNLCFLDLRDNLISRLEIGAFRNLPKLQALDLENNKLGEIRKGVFDNISVWILDLRDNDISGLEEGVFLDIRPAKEGFGVVVWLQNNKLEVINREVFDNVALKWLDLSNNSISVIHQGDLSNVPHLESLRLGGNQIETIPEGVFNGSKLRAINLSGNKISTVAGGAFDNMRYLHRIDMSHNRLKIWNGAWFTGSKISKISLAHNYIEIIPSGAFRNFQNYSTIDLHSNRIRTISPDAFEGLTQLEGLVLKNNGLTFWDSRLLEKVHVVENVDVSGNKIPCSEELKSKENLVIDNCR